MTATNKITKKTDTSSNLLNICFVLNLWYIQHLNSFDSHVEIIKINCFEEINLK